jgi:hypothetical protein
MLGEAKENSNPSELVTVDGKNAGDWLNGDNLQNDDMLRFHHNDVEDGIYSVAISRLNGHGSLSGMGEALQLTFELVETPVEDIVITVDRVIVAKKEGVTTSSAFEFTSGQVTSYRPDESLPTEYELSSNYPNPFNPTTRIEYALPEPGLVVLEVYDTLGRLVATLVNESKEAGRHAVDFDATNLASGIYLYRIQAGSFTQTRTMMLVK